MLERIGELIDSNDNLIQQLEECIISRNLAEARIEDLRTSLNYERERFDKAIDYDRELHKGIRQKVGLIPKDQTAAGSVEGSQQPRPVVSGRVPWRHAQSDLQRASQEQVRKTEEHWHKKIADVERQDAERARTTDSGREEN